jgi:8-oxo-dGTP diphosphatase
MGRADQKVIPGRYQVYPRTLCFILSGTDVLLIRGAPDKEIWPNLYNGVGGHVEPDEDVYSAARREITEETGLAVRDLHLRGIINIPVPVEDTGVMLFVFTARALDRSCQASSEGSLEWVALNRVGDLPVVEDLPTLLPRVLAHRDAAPPFFARYWYDDEDRLRAVFNT